MSFLIIGNETEPDQGIADPVQAIKESIPPNQSLFQISRKITHYLKELDIERNELTIYRILNEMQNPGPQIVDGLNELIETGKIHSIINECKSGRYVDEQEADRFRIRVWQNVNAIIGEANESGNKISKNMAIKKFCYSLPGVFISDTNFMAVIKGKNGKKLTRSLYEKVTNALDRLESEDEKDN